MIDGFQIYLIIRNVLDRVRLMPGQVEHASKDTGEVLNNSIKNDVFVELYDGQVPGVTIRGSLHKLYSHAGNDTLFTFSQLRKTVESLAWRFCINLREPCLQHLEFAVNIFAKCPEAVIDSAVLYYDRPATNRTLTKKFYYKEWEFEDYSVKLYRKGASLLRFEVHIKRMRALDGGRVRSLEDLRRRDVFVRCLAHLYTCVDKFVFVPSKVGSLPDDLKEIWALRRNDTYWQQLKSYQRTREKKRVLEAIKNYDLIDWARYLKKNIIASGAQMLGINEDQLVAMFSTLGLDAETVAGPVGNCDRLTDLDKDDYSFSSLWSVCLSHTVANGGLSHTLEVVRVYSDVHLGGRGPPAQRYSVLN